MTPRNTTLFWFVGIGVFVTLGSLLLGIWTLRDGLQNSNHARWNQEASLLNSIGKQLLQPNTPPALPQHTGLRFTVLDQAGKVIADSHYQNLAAHEDRPEIKSALAGKIGQSIRFSKTSKEELQYTAFPIQQGALIIGVSRIAIPTQMINQIETDVLKDKAPLFFLLTMTFWLLLTGAYFTNKRHTQRMIQALRDRHSDHVLADIPDLHKREIQDVCIALTEKLATELTQKELALEEKKAILDHLTERVLLVAPNDEIVHLNPAAKQLFSISNAQTLYVSHTCRNSVFLDTVKQALNNQVVNNKRIVFHTPTGPISLMVTGVPVLLNKQVHALLLLATPTYTWMPTYTKLIQLWIEKKDKLPAAHLCLQTMNETHTKLCKSTIGPKGFSAADVLQAARSLEIPITCDVTPDTATCTYLMDLSLVMTILIATRLCYDQPSLRMTRLASELTLTCQCDIHVHHDTKQPLDHGLYTFIEALIVYFQATLQPIPSGFQITLKES